MRARGDGARTVASCGRQAVSALLNLQALDVLDQVGDPLLHLAVVSLADAGE